MAPSLDDPSGDPSDLSGRVRELLGELAAVDPASIALDARFSDLGIDSVSAVALLGRLEETFDLTIPADDALHLTTVGAVVRYLGRQAARGGR
jgi:acyl carrier protein